MSTISFSRDELLYDISNMAYVVGDISAGSASPHSLHQTFDICEKGNIDRIDRLLGNAFAEAGTILRKVTVTPPDEEREIGNSDPYPAVYRLTLLRGKVSEDWRIRLKEAVHEYMVARALHGWLSVTLPEAADVWEAKAEDARSMISACATASARANGVRRPLSPF